MRQNREEYEKRINQPASGEPARSAGLTELESTTFYETDHAVKYYQKNHGMTVEQALKWIYQNGHERYMPAYQGKGGLKKFKETYYSAKEKMDKYLAEHPEIQEKPGETGEKLV